MFVDCVPSKDQRLRMGQKVRCKEGAEAMIDRVTADRVCLRIRQHNLWSFRWIERANAPKELTLILQHQKELKQYQFAVTADPILDSDDLIDSKSYQFDSIESFRIPLDALNGSAAAIDGVHIYVKPKGEDVGYALFKSLQAQH